MRLARTLPPVVPTVLPASPVPLSCRLESLHHNGTAVSCGLESPHYKGTVVQATPTDLAYVVHIQKRHGDAVGFLPRCALAEKIDRGQVWLGLENDEPAGFLHHGSLAVPEVRLFQAAVQFDARRRRLGLALVADLVDRASAAGARAISLRCLSFLDANAFWDAAGFALLGDEPGAKGTLNVWGRRLQNVGGGDSGVGCNDSPPTPRPLLPTPHVPFHSRLHPCPACGRPTFDTWTRGAVRRRLCRACVAAAGARPVAAG